MRRKIPKGHALDVAAELARQHSRNPLLVTEPEKIAAEYKARNRVFDAHKENERIKAQRSLWAFLPEFGPGAAAADALKRAIIERAWELLDMGQCEACDALLEFAPEADASKMLNEYFAEDGQE